MTRTESILRGPDSLGVCIFVFTFCLRLFALTQLAGSPLFLPHSGDMAFYNHWAQRILGGELTDGRAFYALPLYAYWLATLHLVFGGSEFIPGLVQCGVDAGTAVLLYKIAYQVMANSAAADERRTIPYRGQIVGTLCAATWAFFLPAQAFSIVQMPTTLSVFAFWFLVWQIIKRTEPARFSTVFLFGVLIGVTAMAVATILFIIPLLLAAVVWRWRGPSTNWKSGPASSAVLLCGVVLGTAPCWLHNSVVAKDPVFLSAHSGINFWIGNNPVAIGYPAFGELRAGQAEMLQDSVNRAEQAAGKPLLRSEVSAYWSAKARAYIASDFVGWLRLLGTKLWNSCNAFQYDDLSVIEQFRERGFIFPGPKFGIIAAAAVAAIPFVLRSFAGARWIFASVLLQMASILPVFVTERYRLPAVPGLIVLAMLGIWRLWEDCVFWRFRAALAYLIVFLAASLIISHAPANPSLWALAPYNAGREALDENDLPVAQKKLDRAYAYVPGNAEINLALGNLWLARGEREKARAYYNAALRAEPRHKAALNNLGVIAFQEQQWELAKHFFQRALEISPNDSKTHYLLARTYLKMGNAAGAMIEIETAMRLQPAQPEFRTFFDAMQTHR